MHQTGLTRARSMGPVVEALERAGASPQRVFRRAGLPFGLVEQPDQLIPLRDQLTLVAIATKELDEATLPLRLSRAGGIESLGAFGQRVLRASTLATSICACNENIQLMLQTMTRMSLTRSGVKHDGPTNSPRQSKSDGRRTSCSPSLYGRLPGSLCEFDLIRAELPTAPAEKSRLEEALAVMCGSARRLFGLSIGVSRNRRIVSAARRARWARPPADS